MPSGIGGGGASVVWTSLTAPGPSTVGTAGAQHHDVRVDVVAAGDRAEARQRAAVVERDLGEAELGPERLRPLHVGDADSDVVDAEHRCRAHGDVARSCSCSRYDARISGVYSQCEHAVPGRRIDHANRRKASQQRSAAPRTSVSRDGARRSSAAGFDSLWVSDHIVHAGDDRVALPVRGRRPSDVADRHAVRRRADRARAGGRGRPSGFGSAPRCSCCRSATRSSSPSRRPSIDVASGGRLELGVGAGWLAEEFAALGVPFETRGARMVEWMRDRCASAGPAAQPGARPSATTLPAGIAVPADARARDPAADRRPLAGRAATRRHGRRRLARAAGSPDQLDPRAIDVARRAEAGAEPVAPASCCGSSARSAATELVAQRLDALERAGVDEVIVDVPVDDARQRVREVLPMTVLAGRRALTGGAAASAPRSWSGFAREGATGRRARPAGGAATARCPTAGGRRRRPARRRRRPPRRSRAPRSFAACRSSPPPASSRRWAPIAELDLAEWDAVFAVNARGVVATLKHASPRIRDGGAIVVIASLNSWRGDPNLTTYVASKHAALGIVRSAALDLGRRGIRVNGRRARPDRHATRCWTACAGARREGGLTVDDALAQAGAGRPRSAGSPPTDDVADGGAVPRQRPRRRRHRTPAAGRRRHRLGGRPGPARQDGAADRRVGRHRLGDGRASCSQRGAHLIAHYASDRDDAEAACADAPPERWTADARPTSRSAAARAAAVARGARVARPHRRRRRQRRDRCPRRRSTAPTSSGTTAGSARCASTCSSRRSLVREAVSHFLAARRRDADRRCRVGPRSAARRSRS